MKLQLNSAGRAIRAFARDESGAQVVEYALIIAVVSIALVIALSNLKDIPIGDLVSLVGTCLSGGACTS